MDTISLHGISVECFIGVNPEEKLQKQKLVIDVELYCSTEMAGKSDDLKDTISYAAVFEKVKDFVENKRFNLIEKAAEECAAIILQQFDVEAVKVIVKKKPLDLMVEDVQVCVKRCKSF